MKGEFTPTQFRERIWPYVIGLCNQKELPAQALYTLLKNHELIINFVSQQEFNQVFLPLITKSLSCGIPKLQQLALSRVKGIFSQMDYQLIKSQIIPRVLQILETAKMNELKIEVIDTIKHIVKSIDAQTLKGDMMKSLEKFRANESHP